ncbi:MAG: ABC transporter ATP-binding protein, partial [Clostridia bacterium]|nr:ABC transporter ATP-binding protein [Clostridia bacterium]
FKDANKDLKNAGLKAIYVMICLMPMMMLFMNLSIVAVLWFGGKFVAYEGMPIGDLSAFITYITQILMSLMMVSVMFITSSRALASAKRIKEVLDEPLDLTDDLATDKEKQIKQGKIEFKDVSFKYYKNSERKVLENINLTIPAGKTVGIIGSTGCGKTTLVSLISRLYDTDSGQVLVDDTDVKEYSLKNLRDGIGMVLQKNLLFSGTVAENLRWGDDNATSDMIESVAKQAEAHDFVLGFKGGYDASIEQGGSNVSGGQKQRLCIARALLKNPKILILDDSTSAVDTATEAKIREAFKNQLKDSTKIIIAQRISSVKDADEIIVMEEGQIVGKGTHDELITSCPEYVEIFSSQTENKNEQEGR